MGDGLASVFPGATFVARPIADGGEGLVGAIVAASPEIIGSEMKAIGPQTAGPGGEDVFPFALSPDGTAVIEMASTAGLDLCRQRGLTHRTADTFGVGLQIAALAGAFPGVERIVVGLGGSGTNDGGWGMARALGWREENGRLVAPGTKLPKIVAACDVTNPLLGPNGCTRVFGPQKGITPDDFEWHEARLARLAAHFPAELAETPGAGAAGGLGFGLLAFCNAHIESGFSLFASLAGLQAAIASADLVVTGEGSLDAQTLNGKGPHGVARMAHAAGKPVLGIAGRVTPDARPAFDLSLAVSPADLPLAEAQRLAPQLIHAAIARSADAIRALLPSHPPA